MEISWEKLPCRFSFDYLWQPYEVIVLVPRARIQDAEVVSLVPVLEIVAGLLGVPSSCGTCAQIRVQDDLTLRMRCPECLELLTMLATVVVIRNEDEQIPVHSRGLPDQLWLRQDDGSMQCLPLVADRERLGKLLHVQLAVCSVARCLRRLGEQPRDEEGKADIDRVESVVGWLCGEGCVSEVPLCSSMLPHHFAVSLQCAADGDCWVPLAWEATRRTLASQSDTCDTNEGCQTDDINASHENNGHTRGPSEGIHSNQRSSQSSEGADVSSSNGAITEAESEDSGDENVDIEALLKGDVPWKEVVQGLKLPELFCSMFLQPKRWLRRLRWRLAGKRQTIGRAMCNFAVQNGVLQRSLGRGEGFMVYVRGQSELLGVVWVSLDKTQLCDSQTTTHAVNGHNYTVGDLVKEAQRWAVGEYDNSGGGEEPEPTGSDTLFCDLHPARCESTPIMEFEDVYSCRALLFGLSRTTHDDMLPWRKGSSSHPFLQHFTPYTEWQVGVRSDKSEAVVRMSSDDVYCVGGAAALPNGGKARGELLNTPLSEAYRAWQTAVDTSKTASVHEEKTEAERVVVHLFVLPQVPFPSRKDQRACLVTRRRQTSSLSDVSQELKRTVHPSKQSEGEEGDLILYVNMADVKSHSRSAFPQGFVVSAAVNAFEPIWCIIRRLAAVFDLPVDRLRLWVTANDQKQEDARRGLDLDKIRTQFLFEQLSLQHWFDSWALSGSVDGNSDSETVPDYSPTAFFVRAHMTACGSSSVSGNASATGKSRKPDRSETSRKAKTSENVVNGECKGAKSGADGDNVSAAARWLRAESDEYSGSAVMPSFTLVQESRAE